MAIINDIRISDILEKQPDLVSVFIGLPCLLWGEPFWGTAKELSKEHDAAVGLLVEEINNKDTKTP